MKAVVIYESLTGNTKRAAGVVGDELQRQGVEVLGIYPTTGVEYQALADADVVVVGTWVDGVFVVGQRPGRSGRLKGLPAMAGKQVAVYCTFALNPGKTLEKMTGILEAKGATVIGGLAIRRDDLEGGSVDLVGRLLDAVAA